MQWQIDRVTVDGKTKRRIRAKGYSSNRTTIIGDSIIQMLSDMQNTSIQSIPGAYVRKMVAMCEAGIYVIEGFEVVVVHAGTNDQCKSSILEVLVSLRRVVQYIRAQNPSCRIAICGLLPRPVDAQSKVKIDKLDNLNQAIEDDCVLINVFFIKTERALKGKSTSNIYLGDGIHLTLEGAWYLQNYLEGVIGAVMGIPPQWDPIGKVVITKK
jgi:hypothetical protein